MPSPGPGPGPDSEPLYMMKNVPNSLPGGVSTGGLEGKLPSLLTDFTDSLTARRVLGWLEPPQHRGHQEATME